MKKKYTADVGGGKRNATSNNSKQNQESELSLISSGLPRVLYLHWAWGGQGCHGRLVLKATAENDFNIYNSEKNESLTNPSLWLLHSQQESICISAPALTKTLDQYYFYSVLLTRMRVKVLKGKKNKTKKNLKSILEALHF